MHAHSIDQTVSKECPTRHIIYVKHAHPPYVRSESHTRSITTACRWSCCSHVPLPDWPGAHNRFLPGCMLCLLLRKACMKRERVHLLRQMAQLDEDGRSQPHARDTTNIRSGKRQHAVLRYRHLMKQAPRESRGRSAETTIAQSCRGLPSASYPPWLQGCTKACPCETVRRERPNTPQSPPA